MAVQSDFQAPILNEVPSTSVAEIGDEEIERRRQALQYALSYCLSAEEMAHTVRLCENEFARKKAFSVSEFCQRLFETMPEVQLDKESRLRLLRAMRQPTKAFNAATEMTMPKPAEAPSIQLPSPEDSSSPELVMVTEPPPTMPTPEDSTSPELVTATDSSSALPVPEDLTSPELFVLRYVNFGKDIIG